MMTPEQFTTDLDAGPYAWPGGYPTFFLMADSGALCHNCASEHADLIRGELAADCPDPEWCPVQRTANWEDPELFCDHCNNRIESAYAEED